MDQTFGPETFGTRLLNQNLEQSFWLIYAVESTSSLLFGLEFIKKQLRKEIKSLTSELGLSGRRDDAV